MTDRDTMPDPATDPAFMRKQYRARGLDEPDLAGHPMDQFARWFADAARAAVHGTLYEPNAMVVSTVDPAGRPGSRTVLMKGYDTEGFVFYTNYDSHKARDLAGNPYVSLLFPWHPIARQVIVSGVARRTSREETAAYFHSRPHGSQLGAWASAQSTVVGSRAELDEAYAALGARYPEGAEVPVPPHWGGFRVAPETVEFWQGRENRLHDRLRYAALPDGTWTVDRLSP
ncbi:pyridoxamine 5'-phosphate oxidase [Streptomyces sp. NPDC003656]|uniref:pyridoxamine 5'-phosphate oxidase n=1 Tax=unclassified Streptomyces TaxID=2593676 RepID=UPI0018F422FA|nr:pyridoxamine 5'-phosphate oxidase [Streptomyces sp. DSM 110735]MBJ7906669.1 pyridoxamine 5'-phosphate oxidase [Streptomyces sp. DSM 110735]